MTKTRAEAARFVRALAASDVAHDAAVDLFVVPSFTAVAAVARLLAATRVRVGVQDVHWADAGAFTGEISAAMAVDCGATIAEIGHGERRAAFGDTDERVARKTAAALRHGLTPLVCVGETRAERDVGRPDVVLTRQVRAAASAVTPHLAGRVVFAYEPLWAIGAAGVAADPAYVRERHAAIAHAYAGATGSVPRVLYGGSVDAENCATLAAQPGVDGLFVGRAAWEIEGFLTIVRRALAGAP